MEITLETYRFLEEKGVVIHYHPEYYPDGGNLCFSIEFYKFKEGKHKQQTYWYNDNHECGDVMETMIFSIKVALWYLEDESRIQLINGGCYDEKYNQYTDELGLFLETLYK